MSIDTTKESLRIFLTQQLKDVEQDIEMISSYISDNPPETSGELLKLRELQRKYREIAVSLKNEIVKLGERECERKIAFECHLIIKSPSPSSWGEDLWQEYRRHNPDGLKVPPADLMDCPDPDRMSYFGGRSLLHKLFIINDISDSKPAIGRAEGEKSLPYA
jgi:hypothetical protein